MPAARRPEEQTPISADRLWEALRFDPQDSAYCGKYLVVTGSARVRRGSGNAPSALIFDSDDGPDIIFATISAAHAREFAGLDLPPATEKRYPMTICARCIGLGRGFSRKVYMDDARLVSVTDW